MAFFKQISTVCAVVFTFSLSSLSAGLSFRGSSFSAPTINLSGECYCEDTFMTTLVMNGSITFKNLTIEKDAEFFEEASGEGLTATNIKAHSSMEGARIVVTGKTEVEGRFEVSESTLNQVVLHNEHNTISNSTVGSISVVKLPEANMVQQVHLLGTTVVEGDIIFESEKGELHIEDTAVVKGNVIGATTIKR